MPRVAATQQRLTAYIDSYQQRPHSGLAYRSPAEVAATWRPDPDVLQPQRPEPSTAAGSTSEEQLQRCDPMFAVTTVVTCRGAF
jgi:hypothetical protein